MDFCLANFIALALLFFLVISGAPVLPGSSPGSSPGSCVDVQNSSLVLNQIARNVSVEARKGLETDEEVIFNTSLVWMEAKDMCDPGTLKKNSTPCIGKMLRVLDRYISLVNTISVFESCSELARKVMPGIQKLHKDMTKCATGEGSDEKKESHVDDKDEVQQWEKPYLCYYTLDRLFSFSILTARVFARGDPAQHTSGAAQKCT